MSSLLCTRGNITIPAPQKTLEVSHGVPHQLEMTTVLRIGIIASLPPHQTQVGLDLLDPVALALDLEEVLQAPTLMVSFFITYLLNYTMTFR